MAEGSRLFGLRKDLWFKFKGNWARNPGNVHTADQYEVD